MDSLAIAAAKICCAPLNQVRSAHSDAWGDRARKALS